MVPLGVLWIIKSVMGILQIRRSNFCNSCSATNGSIKFLIPVNEPSYLHKGNSKTTSLSLTLARCHPPAGCTYPSPSWAFHGKDLQLGNWEKWICQILLKGIAYLGVAGGGGRIYPNISCLNYTIIGWVQHCEVCDNCIFVKLDLTLLTFHVKCNMQICRKSDFLTFSQNIHQFLLISHELEILSEFSHP